MNVNGKRTPIWLDCDTGHDDAFAILLAAHHNEASLLGVSTVHGNAPVEDTTHNSLAVLEAIGASHIPVVHGRDRPLRRDPSFAPDIHGESGLDGVTLLPKEPSASPLSNSLTDVVNTILDRPPNTVHIVATGPLTNIAILFSWSQELALHIAGLYIMGGAVGNEFTNAPLGRVAGEGERFGNWSPWAEFNIYADPEAARTVFSNKRLAAKTTLIPLDVTHLVRGTYSVQRLLFGDARTIEPVGRMWRLSKVRNLFQEILNYFASTYKAQFGIADGPPLHDPLAVWAALEPQMFYDGGIERWDVDVVVKPGQYDPVRNSQNHLGQTIIKQSKDGKGVRIPRDLDIDRFWRRIDEALRAAEHHTLRSIPSGGPGTPIGSSPRTQALIEELDKRKASLNAWRGTRPVPADNGTIPQV